jgi:hypothetical protein
VARRASDRRDRDRRRRPGCVALNDNRVHKLEMHTYAPGVLLTPMTRNVDIKGDAGPLGGSRVSDLAGHAPASESARRQTDVTSPAVTVPAGRNPATDPVRSRSRCRVSDGIKRAMASNVKVRATVGFRPVGREAHHDNGS